MKRPAGIQVDLQLIGKYLSGEASPEEALAIDVWRAESPENNQMFESVSRVWEAAASEGAYLPPQHRDKWEKLKEVLHSRKEADGQAGKRAALRWKVAAAVSILLVGAITFYLLRPHKSATIYDKAIGSNTTIVKDVLRDSTIVSLFRQSRLFVQEQFAVTGREVKLEGQAYFSVKQLSDQPFIIHTAGIRIVVLGTQFNVKNYPEKVTVGVREGVVKMQKDSASIIVKAGSTGTFNKTDQRFALFVDSLNINTFSYATGELYFDNASMNEVKNILENAYGIQVQLKDRSLANLRINTRFKKQPLAYVVKVISASLGIQYYLKDDTLYFFKGKAQ